MKIFLRYLITLNVVQVARRKEHDALWEKVRSTKEWKERFGASAESVMKALRGRGFLEKLKPDGAENISMDELEERAKAQLMMIEQVYALKITNRDEVAKLIASKVDNDRQVLTICTSLNSWVLLNKKRGNITIPREVLSRLFETTEWQKKHA